MTERNFVAATCALLCVLAGAGCNDDMDDANTSSQTKKEDKASQRPPQGAEAIEAWLADGDYNDWQCEPEIHEARLPSPHGWNRICSNDAISSRATGTGEWPAGAAAVK